MQCCRGLSIFEFFEIVYYSSCKRMSDGLGFQYWKFNTIQACIWDSLFDCILRIHEYFAYWNLMKT